MRLLSLLAAVAAVATLLACSEKSESASQAATVTVSAPTGSASEPPLTGRTPQAGVTSGATAVVRQVSLTLRSDQREYPAGAPVQLNLRLDNVGSVIVPLGFHLQEFDTMVRHGLPIVNVVLNNQVWGMSIHGQQMMYGANYSAITKIPGTHYANIARAFGCHSERVERFEDIAPALERALASGQTSFIEIMTDPEVVHPVTASMLGQIEEGSRCVRTL